MTKQKQYYKDLFKYVFVLVVCLSFFVVGLQVGTLKTIIGLDGQQYQIVPSFFLCVEYNTLFETMGYTAQSIETNVSNVTIYDPLLNIPLARWT